MSAGDGGWHIEQAAHTRVDRGVPRVAPAIFIGSDSRLSVLGWAPSARATHMILEVGPYRSALTPIDRGIVIAQFGPPVAALTSGLRILYLDDTSEFQRQTFGPTGGFMTTELSVRRDR